MIRSMSLHSKRIQKTLEIGEREFLDAMEHQFGEYRFSVEYEPSDVRGDDVIGDLDFYAERTDPKNPDRDEVLASYTWTVTGRSEKAEDESLRDGFAAAPDAIREQLRDLE